MVCLPSNAGHTPSGINPVLPGLAIGERGDIRAGTPIKQGPGSGGGSRAYTFGGDSMSRVTGPSFTSSTSMWAPKTPLAGGNPAAAKASQASS